MRSGVPGLPCTVPRLFLGFLAAGVVVAVAVGLTGCQATRAGYASAPYRVVRTDGKVEVRDYPELRLAETPMGGDDFMRLFGYISRGNSGNEKIAMTTPVFMAEPAGSTRTMAFVLPEGLATPPSPTDSAVANRRMGPGRFAVLRFRGSRQGPEGEAAMRLRTWIRTQGLATTGVPTFAYFDPPWTPGFLRRNEVMIPLAEPAIDPLR